MACLFSKISIIYFQHRFRLDFLGHQVINIAVQIIPKTIGIRASYLQSPSKRPEVS
jgi:hypothetical protein